MGIFFHSLLVDVVAIFITVVMAIFTYISWSLTYWQKKNVPHLKQTVLSAILENPLTSKQSISFWIKTSYDELKSQGHKHGGLYNFAVPAYLPIDPEFVKNVMQKDFAHFVDRGTFCNERDDPLSGHLFALGGEKWKSFRTKLTPTFTSGKMKMMFDILVQCSAPMLEAVDGYCRKKEAVDIKEMVARFSTDIIGSAAFGLDCNSFESPDAEFRSYGRKTFQFTLGQRLKFLLFLANPRVGRWLRLTITPKDVSEFFLKVVKDAVDYRETNKVVRKDMLQLLIELKNREGRDGKSITIEQLTAQVYVFFFAGFETSSTTMTFFLFELASNPDIQHKVREEINEVLAKHNGQITYEAMTELKYMSQVIDETLRKYPPVASITRKCVKNYQVPDTDVKIEKGTTVFISTLGLHHDPEYYPNPTKFDPERFSEENKKLRHPFTHIPFGEGPRICIGLRFGVMQVKVGLTVLLRNYIFFVNKKTEVPLQMDPKSVVLSAKGTIWLDLEKVN